MRVLIDGDGCPVNQIIVDICKKYNIICIILCDTAHEIYKEGAETVTIDKGSDSVDFAIANRVQPGDVVVTQDYGLASMCLAKNARVLHQDGWEYTQYNIDALMFERHATQKYRTAGFRTKGPSKRKVAQDRAFSKSLEHLLQQTVQG